MNHHVLTCLRIGLRACDLICGTVNCECLRCLCGRLSLLVLLLTSSIQFVDNLAAQYPIWLNIDENVVAHDRS